MNHNYNISDRQSQFLTPEKPLSFRKARAKTFRKHFFGSLPKIAPET